jgi:hypothetical protein
MPGLALDSQDPAIQNPVFVEFSGQELQALAQRDDLGSILASPEVGMVSVLLRPRVAIDVNAATLEGLGTYQAVALADGDLILLWGQTDPTQNGPWVVHADINGVAQSWTRPALPFGHGASAFVLAGTYAAKILQNTTVSRIIYGTTSIGFVLASAAGAPAAHAATHEDGGADDLLSAPGEIGRVTPAKVNGTDFYLGASAGSPTSGKLQLSATASQDNLVVTGPAGNNVSFGQVPSSATARAANRTLSITLADNGTYDFDNASLGGMAVIASSNGSVFAAIGFSTAAVSTTGGQTYTNFSTTLTTASKLNVGASGGKLRFENKTGGALSIVADITLFVAA